MIQIVESDLSVVQKCAFIDGEIRNNAIDTQNRISRKKVLRCLQNFQILNRANTALLISIPLDRSRLVRLYPQDS